jgi:eukaryotic-like serine/threonine-protein kinase
VLPNGIQASAFQLIATPSQEIHGRVSPNGRWIAYCSDESGFFEVYVQDFKALTGNDRTSPKWTVSSGGGCEPVWRHDGSELFYRAPTGAVYASRAESGGDAFRAGSAKLLFDGRRAFSTSYFTSYDVSPDGERFIMVEPVTEPGSTPLYVLTDWRALTRIP